MRPTSLFKIAVLGIAGNLLLALVKGIAGFSGNSYALIADAVESTGDIFSSILLLLGLRYASKPADKNHPYGHGRAEPLITFIIVMFLTASAVLIIVQSIRNIQTPHELPAPYTLIVLAAVVVVKEIFYRIVNRQAHASGSTSVAAEAWHHRSDALTSAVAFVGISLALWMGKGYEAADDWAALFAALVILYNSFRIFRPALGEIMDEHLYDELVERIRSVAKDVEGVRGTEKCHIRKTGFTYYVDLHAEVDGSLTVKEGHDIAHALRDELVRQIPSIAEVLVHIEPCAATPRA